MKLPGPAKTPAVSANMEQPSPEGTEDGSCYTVITPGSNYSPDYVINGLNRGCLKAAVTNPEAVASQ